MSEQLPEPAGFLPQVSQESIDLALAEFEFLQHAELDNMDHPWTKGFLQEQPQLATTLARYASSIGGLNEVEEATIRGCMSLAYRLLSTEASLAGMTSQGPKGREQALPFLDRAALHSFMRIDLINSDFVSQAGKRLEQAQPDFAQYLQLYIRNLFSDRNPPTSCARIAVLCMYAAFERFGTAEAADQQTSYLPPS